jgi:hypothetical protein
MDVFLIILLWAFIGHAFLTAMFYTTLKGWYQRMELMRLYSMYRGVLITPSGRSARIDEDRTDRLLALYGVLGLFVGHEQNKDWFWMCAPWNTKVYNRYMENKWDEISRANVNLWNKFYPEIPVRKPEKWDPQDLLTFGMK